MRKAKGERARKDREEERESQSETDALFESGLLWQHSVSMATIKISLHS